MRCLLQLPTGCFLLLLPILSTGCGNDAIPKPRGYFRIDLPPDSTKAYTGPCPFTAEIPAYAVMATDAAFGGADGHSCWTNMVFPAYKAAVHITWRQVKGDLPELINDAHEFKAKHEVMATRIRDEAVSRPEARVYGTLFDVEGNVASPMVFYLTDSTSNFLYGALYFNVRPNADSLGPVADRIRADIRRMARTLRWQDVPGAVQHVQQGH